MDLLGSNPFVVFTVIAAPAVLTNSAAVMSLTTANRLARAVDRARALVTEMSGPCASMPDDTRRFRLEEIDGARQRALLLIRALGAFQFAFGGFALATLLALTGAALGLLNLRAVNLASLAVVLACKSVAVASILRGSYLLVRESQKAYVVLFRESQHLTDPPSPGTLG